MVTVRGAGLTKGGGDHFAAVCESIDVLTMGEGICVMYSFTAAIMQWEIDLTHGEI